jgi:hypothetical protein
MQCKLLLNPLRHRPEFQTASCNMEIATILASVESSQVQVAIMNVDHPRESWHNMSVVRRLHLANPTIA